MIIMSVGVQNHMNLHIVCLFIPCWLSPQGNTDVYAGQQNRVQQLIAKNEYFNEAPTRTESCRAALPHYMEHKVLEATEVSRQLPHLPAGD